VTSIFAPAVFGEPLAVSIEPMAISAIASDAAAAMSRVSLCFMRFSFRGSLPPAPG
jgi:hypothetical protein